MRQVVLLDTGPLVAIVNRRDKFHDWIKMRFDVIEPPLFTCEAVLAEACFLLRKYSVGSAAVLKMVQREVVKVDMQISQQVPSITNLMVKYANVPISLADACLVRMSELFSESVILTLDSNFRLYRRHGRQVIPLIIPS